MRIYTKFYEAVKETERELIEMGTIVNPESMQDKDVKNNPDYETKELQGYGYVITTHIDLTKDFIKLGGNIKYAKDEFSDRIYVGWLNPGLAWTSRKEVWEPFLRNGKFAYTYNERIRAQVSQIISELSTMPNTRQAVITIYDHHQDLNNLGGRARIPCSMYYQFLRRKREDKEVLDVIYTMRSCDIYTHFIYDIYLTMQFQEYIAGCLGIVPGHFTHFIGSLHAYKKDYTGKGVF